MKGVVSSIVLVFALLAGAVVYSQTPQALSDGEKLRLENLNLKQTLAATLKTLAETQSSLGQCQAQVNAGVIRQDAAQLKLELDSARPGWEYNFEKGTFVKKGEEKKPAAPK